MQPALDLRGVVKTYGGLRANDGVDLVIGWGRVHALLGENGAGKSTLMNVIYGLVKPDAGEISFDGRRVTMRRPSDAIDLGIGMVHQHFMLIPPLTVAENVVLGAEPGRFGAVDLAAAARLVNDLGRRHGLEVPADARIETLPVGIQQRVEIIKALYRGARLLILDEPTAVLTPQEADGLFAVMRSLAEAGNAVIFITHKLAEVLRVADDITVMRRGRVVATTTPSATDEAGLASLMVGRTVLLKVDREPAQPGLPLLELKGLKVSGEHGRPAVEGVDLTIHAGEIVGVAGVEGNGQEELVEAIVGLRPLMGGEMRLDGRALTRRSIRARLRSGLGIIHADRHRLGLITELSVADNLVLGSYDRPPFVRGFVRALEQVRRFARQLTERFDIRTAGPDQAAGALSGGNQQKLVAARELSAHPSVLVAAQPTRGVDVGSIEFIHRRLIEHRDAGRGVLLVSSELDEVLALSDRVAVMFGGRIVAVLSAGGIDRDRIGLLMAGAA